MQYILNHLKDGEDYNFADAEAIVFPSEAEGSATLAFHHLATPELLNRTLWEAVSLMGECALEPFLAMKDKGDVAVVHVRDPLSVGFFPDPRNRSSGWTMRCVFAVTLHNKVPKRFKDRGTLDHFPLWVSKPNIDKDLNGKEIARVCETLVAGWGEKPPQAVWVEDL